MFRTIISGGLHGMDSYLVHVEVDASQGLPVFEIVGYQSGEVRDVTMVRLIQSIIKKSA